MKKGDIAEQGAMQYLLLNSFNVSHILALTVFLYHNIIWNLIERNGGENCEEK